MDRRRLQQALTAALAAEHAPDGELALVFIGERAMRHLNLEFRGIAEPTDVLSFSYLNEPHAGGQLGEIFIAASVAARHAVEAGCSLPEEIARVALHGLLHVLGYVHDTPVARRRMTSRQERYLERFLADVPLP